MMNTSVPMTTKQLKMIGEGSPRPSQGFFEQHKETINFPHEGYGFQDGARDFQDLRLTGFKIKPKINVIKDFKSTPMATSSTRFAAHRGHEGSWQGL